MKNKGIYLLKNALFFCISKGIAFLAPLLFVKFVTLENMERWSLLILPVVFVLYF